MSKLSSIKKTKLTYDQAETLEQLLTDYTNDFRRDGSRSVDLQALARVIGCPKSAIDVIFIRTDALFDDVFLCAEETNRGNCEAVIAAYGMLDACLRRLFTVAKHGKREFKWNVGA